MRKVTIACIDVDLNFLLFLKNKKSYFVDISPSSAQNLHSLNKHPQNAANVLTLMNFRPLLALDFKYIQNQYFQSSRCLELLVYIRILNLQFVFLYDNILTLLISMYIFPKPPKLLKIMPFYWKFWFNQINKNLLLIFSKMAKEISLWQRLVLATTNAKL